MASLPKQYNSDASNYYPPKPTSNANSINNFEHNKAYERLFQADINITLPEDNSIYYSEKDKELLATADQALCMKNEFERDVQPSYLDIYHDCK